ncbi:hypothetical protein ABTD35_21055, partial [Acinetobacter baumannii]
DRSKHIYYKLEFYCKSKEGNMQSRLPAQCTCLDQLKVEGKERKPQGKRERVSTVALMVQADLGWSSVRDFWGEEEEKRDWRGR